MKTIGKRRMDAKMFGLLSLLLLLGVFTGEVLSGADLCCSDKHIKTGLRCESCHGAAKPDAGATVRMAKCLSCHGPYKELAKKTEKMIRNPHADPHSGDLPCDMCHHGHRADENYCSSCHKE